LSWVLPGGSVFVLSAQRFGERRASAVLENKTTLAARPFHL